MQQYRDRQKPKGQAAARQRKHRVRTNEESRNVTPSELAPDYVSSMDDSRSIASSTESHDEASSQEPSGILTPPISRQGSSSSHDSSPGLFTNLLLTDNNLMKSLGMKLLDPPKRTAKAEEPVTTQLQKVPKKKPQPPPSLTSVRQRACSARKRMEERNYTADKRAAIVTQMFSTELGRKESRPILTQLIRNDRRINRFIEDRLQEVRQENKPILRAVRRLQTARSKKDFKAVADLAKKLKEKYSLRRVARVYGVFPNAIRYYCKPEPSKHRKNFKGHKVSAINAANCVSHFRQVGVSMQLPYKRFAHLTYLRSALSRAYEEYVIQQRNLGQRVLSLSAVRRCLPKTFRPMKKTPYRQCLCCICLNYHYKSSGLVAKKVRGVHLGASLNVLTALCRPVKKIRSDVRSQKLPPTEKQCLQKEKERNTKEFAISKPQFPSKYWPPSENPVNPVEVKVEKKRGYADELKPPDVDQKTDALQDAGEGDNLFDCERACIFGKCKACGKDPLMNYIIEKNEGFDWNGEAVWFQWEKKKEEKKKRTQFQKVEHRESRKSLLDMWIKGTMKMVTHLFHFKWQADQFESAKANLKFGDVLMVMDFAQNVVHRQTDEPQSAHWSRHQSTLHPVVCFYSCTACRGKPPHIVTDEVLMISPDLVHDPFAVEEYFKTAIRHLRSVGVIVLRVIQFTDNAASQYRSRNAFMLLSEYRIAIQRNTFGSGHGKGPGDSCIGRVVQETAYAVRTGKASIPDGSHFYTFCLRKLATPRVDMDMCQHFRRHFFYLHEIIRPEEELYTARIEGTLGLHCVRNTGFPGIVEVRASSCFCGYVQQ